MANRIWNVFDFLLRWLVPAKGRHRAIETEIVVLNTAETQRCSEPLSPNAFRADYVRPYLTACERRREELRSQRQRRRVLWLATHGIDVDPGPIHGVKVKVGAW